MEGPFMEIKRFTRTSGRNLAEVRRPAAPTPKKVKAQPPKVEKPDPVPRGERIEKNSADE